MVAAGAPTKDDAKKAKKEAEDRAKAEELEKQKKDMEEKFELLLKRISYMDVIADRTENLIQKMETCEENIQLIENSDWLPFLRMGIVGEGEGDPGTMYEDEKKRKEEEFKAEILAKAKAPKGRPPTGYKPHHSHRNRKFVSPVNKPAVVAPELTAVYDAETQSVKCITWEEYLKNNKAPPCSNYVTVYNPYTEEVDLIFWSQYVNMGLYAEDVAARKKWFNGIKVTRIATILTLVRITLFNVSNKEEKKKWL